MESLGLTPQSTFVPKHTQGLVACCLCGSPIQPNPSNMCVNCIRLQVDITEGIPKQVTVLWCKECDRYLNPPKNWVHAELESKELLTFCIKRLKGLQKVKLVDAGFIWTEPHSRRLKAKLTVQSEVFNGAILQQSFVVEYVVEPHMCPDCARHAANPNSWVACVQLRQHVEHKRTFFYLEQLILKHNADANCISIKEMHERLISISHDSPPVAQGVDFFFGNRGHALKFIDFLQSVAPIRFRHDRQLVSQDSHSNTYTYKYTFSVELVPICRDDLLCLPTRTAASLGNLGALTLCTRVTNTCTLVDPATLRSATLEAPAFWRAPFRPVMSSKHLVEFVVLDIEPTGPRTAKHTTAEAQVAKASDFGTNDRTFFVKTHLGNLLHPGDTALGYDLTTANLVDPELERLVARGLALPDVLLVRKSYEEKHRKRRLRGQKRAWKLKRLNLEPGGAEAPVGRKGQDPGPAEQDMEAFMRELEEDPELRSKMALYRDPAYNPVAADAARHPAAMSEEDGAGEEDDEDDALEVPLEELLDDLAAMRIDEDAEMQH